MKKTGLFRLVLCSVTVMLLSLHDDLLWLPIANATAGTRTVADAQQQFAEQAHQRLLPYFEQAEVAYPPQHITFLAIKDTAILELWAGSKSEQHYVRSYPIHALSGVSGPKLRQGDKQVPEGIYRISGLNPNSRFHLSMKINYPNAFDSQYAKAENRTRPGNNIFIHGKAVSIGCLAMGDETIEELFVLAADMGRENIKVVITPSDPRLSPLTPAENSPVWISDLYKQITDAFIPFSRSGA